MEKWIQELADSHSSEMIDPTELTFLANAILKVSRNKQVRCLEIGSWRGTTGVFAHKICSEIDLTWVAIDPMSLYGDPEEMMNPTGSESILIQNIKDANAVDRILPLLSGSNSAYKILGGEWDFVFVDGYHSYQQTLDDLKNYWPLLRLGGVLFLDDYVPEYPGVQKAWDEFQEFEVENIRILTKKWFIVAEKL